MGIEKKKMIMTMKKNSCNRKNYDYVMELKKLEKMKILIEVLNYNKNFIVLTKIINKYP